MTDKIRLGALDISTNEYTLPLLASKDKQYKCIECNKRVILRKGNIRIHHFAHFAKTNTCNYYDHPSESQIHKDAKLLMQKLLNEKRLISFTWECPDCAGFYGLFEIPSIEYKDGDEIVLEYRDKEGKWVADVAIVNHEIVRYIIEVKNTHETITPRPEPWFEIDAVKFIKEIQELFQEAENNPKEYSYRKKLDYIIEIPCIRKNIIRKCYGSFCYKEPWVRRIPGYDEKKNEDNSCILCNKKNYTPTFDGDTGRFQNGEIRVCLECLAKDIYENKLRKLYSDTIERKKALEWGTNGKIEVKETLNDLYTVEEKQILSKIPILHHKFGNENRWRQDEKCIECKKFDYCPIYYEKKFLALCKICFGNKTVQESIKKKINEYKIENTKECLIIDE